MKLSRQQRNRLLNGGWAPLTFDSDPEVTRGDRYVLSRTRETKAHDGAGGTYTVPSEPTLWLEVTTVTRTVSGWTVRFVVHDRRNPALYMHRDSSRGYTTDPALAMRGEPAVTDAETLVRYALEAREQNKLERAKRAAQREAEVLRRRLPELRARGGKRAAEHVRMMERKLRGLEDEAA